MLSLDVSILAEAGKIVLVLVGRDRFQVAHLSFWSGRATNALTRASSSVSRAEAAVVNLSSRFSRLLVEGASLKRLVGGDHVLRSRNRRTTERRNYRGLRNIRVLNGEAGKMDPSSLQSSSRQDYIPCHLRREGSEASRLPLGQDLHHSRLLTAVSHSSLRAAAVAMNRETSSVETVCEKKGQHRPTSSNICPAQYSVRSIAVVGFAARLLLRCCVMLKRRESGLSESVVTRMATFAKHGKHGARIARWYSTYVVDSLCITG